MTAFLAFVAALLVGTAVGRVLRTSLTSLVYRLPEEADLPQPSSWWVVPTTALLTALTWWAIDPGQPMVVPAVYTLAVWTMVPLAFVDLDVQRLPDKIQLPAYPALVVLLGACSLATGAWTSLGRALLAGVTLFALFLVMALIGGGIGFGDVKLAGLLGMLLGWFSWAHVIVATMSTFLIGGLVAIAVLIAGTRGRRDEFAYGPSMLLGAIVALLTPRVLQLLGY